MERTNIVGLSMKGGRKDQFFFCLLEYFEEEGRWFLSSLLHVRDSEGLTGDEAINEWISNFGVKGLVVDFPVSQPACQTCTLECPGVNLCPEKSVVEVRNKMQEILDKDEKYRKESPKKYEHDRNSDDEIDFVRDIMSKPADSYILSRSFKRRLKRGFLPYWNRSVDVWIWTYYYNQLLNLFNISFDSFGNSSLMIQSRFSYLKRHFPKGLTLHESYVPIILTELLRSNIITRGDLRDLSDLDLVIESRLNIIKKIEKAQNIFIYDSDLETLCKNPRAFESFLLAIAAQNHLLKKSFSLPKWTNPEETAFIVPQFS